MKISILGGGIAGLSTAIALKQIGFDVEVYERHSSASNIGAGVVLWPNAIFVLDQLGVLNEIQSLSGLPTKMQRFSNTGEDLGSIDILEINRRMGFQSFSILRRDFQNILISKLNSLDVSIHYGHTIQNIETNGSGKAEVVFQNGLKISSDIIIGADGRMASLSRNYVNGSNHPVYQKFINWVGVFESDENVFDEIFVSDYWGVGERFGIVPVSKNTAYWAGGVASEEIRSRNPEKYKEELQSIFQNWPEPVQLIIEGSAADKINKIYVHDHNPAGIWHKNNLIMIGDAAHAALPTSGQGACQALEDAWNLADCLIKNPHDIKAAFEKFTSLRFEKTSSIIMAARSFASSLFKRDEEFCRRRNENSKASNPAEAAVAMAEFWGQ